MNKHRRRLKEATEKARWRGTMMGRLITSVRSSIDKHFDTLMLLARRGD